MLQAAIDSVTTFFTPGSAVIVTNLLNPHPVTVTDVTKTATTFYVQPVNIGLNVIIAAPGAGNQIRLKALMVFNSGTANITVDLRDSIVGNARFRATLAPNSGWNLNLIGCNWDLSDNGALQANLSAAGAVDVSGMYELV